MPLSENQIRQRAEKIHWYHEFDFGSGVKTKPITSNGYLWAMTQRLLDKVDFRDKTVLDIGCWDGYWSFYAERRGAKSVLATDVNTQRWSKVEVDLKSASTAPVPNEGFMLAREVYNSKVEYNGDISVYDIASLGKRFDIVLFLGVLYHLTYPMYALTQIRHVVDRNGFVVVESGVIEDDERAYLDFYYGSEDGREPYRRMDPSNWVLPTRRCMRDMLKANYFDIRNEDSILHPDDAIKLAPRKLTKTEHLIQSVVRRICNRYSVPLERDPRYGRQVILAQAAEKPDVNYLYAPLMDLHQYDTRFQEGVGGKPDRKP